ncbi:MAG TPA: glycosyltransferase [Thermoleophilaceae bacterium]|nr:glycosyltransferase [Thermoleophilaceae bacterium]
MTLSAPRVSVVFAAHNRAERVRTLLESLERQTLAREAFEVIAVDDGSRDATPEVLAAAAESGPLALRVIRHGEPRGPATARNAGWRAARAELIAFTDDDCHLTPGWLAAALAAWDGMPDRFVQGRTVPDPDEVSSEGPFTRSLRVTALGPYYQTANIFYPRALLERTCGFDETAFRDATAEDADLAWRCLEAGAEPVFAPDALAYHAVHQLGPAGKLRVAWRWHEIVFTYARHPGLRTSLVYKVFWKKSHYHLVRAAIGLALPRHPLLRPLRFWCLQPLAPAYLRRARGEGHGKLWSAPYFLLHDAVELAAMVRGSVRNRILML